MKLAVIVPALNEEATIGTVLDGIPASIPGIDAIKKIVVDDGSTDRTPEIAREHGAQVVRHAVNRGVGAAFSTGLHAALNTGADIIVNIDGDGQFNPAHIADLIQPVVEGRADFATCSRFARADLVPNMPAIKLWGNRLMSLIVSAVTGHRFYDVSCGFRAYRRETALRLNLFGEFTYTQETFLDLARKNAKIVEVPLPVRGEREFGKSRVASSISRYAVRAGSILLLSLRDTRPLVFFGTIGLLVLLLGSAAFAFLFAHWLETGMTTPYQSLVTVSTMLLIVGFLLIVLALVADMLGRLRQNQEELLFLLKRQVYDRTDTDDQR